MVVEAPEAVEAALESINLILVIKKIPVSRNISFYIFVKPSFLTLHCLVWPRVKVCRTARELAHVPRCRGWSPAPVIMPKTIAEHVPVFGAFSYINYGRKLFFILCCCLFYFVLPQWWPSNWDGLNGLQERKVAFVVQRDPQNILLIYGLTACISSDQLLRELLRCASTWWSLTSILPEPL